MTVDELIVMLQSLPKRDRRARVARLVTWPGHFGAVTGVQVRRTRVWQVDADGRPVDDSEVTETTEVVIR